jgi:hypothetical protein
MSPSTRFVGLAGAGLLALLALNVLIILLGPLAPALFS